MFSTIFSLSPDDAARLAPPADPYAALQNKLQSLEVYRTRVKEDQALRQAGMNCHHLAHLKNQMNHIHCQIQTQHLEQQAYVSTSQYQTIFTPEQEDPAPSQFNRLMKDQYFCKYVQQQEPVEFQEPPEVHISLPKEEPYIDQLKNKYQRLQEILGAEEEQEEEKVEGPFCENQKINDVLRPVLENTYDIFFDEIFECLVDELLHEEVVMLNNLEASREEGHKIEYSETEWRVHNIVQALEDYAE